MSSPALRVAPLLFVSGLCALVYQIAWLREFRLVFGASTAASAAVLAIFIGGLGVGGVLIGRRADRHRAPLLLYARLETLIALSAALTPFLLWLVRRAYVAAGGSFTLGLAAGTVVRLLLAALVLAVPTWLMGGTLPAAARAVSTSDDAGRRTVALLYGANTLGAVTGSFIATFFMLELFGTRRTLWLACLVNLLVAMTAAKLARALPAPEGGASDGDAPGEEASPAPARFVLIAAALVGFAFFLMELVWYRVLSPILGGSVFTFGLILTVALLGIGAGGLVYSLRRLDRAATLGGFALTCVLEAFFIAMPYALGDRVAIIAIMLRALGSLWGFWAQTLGWALVASLVVLPAAFVAGYQFPLLIALLGRGGRHVGRQVGLAYAWNTAGAIAGSLMGGFGLLPLLDALGVWRLVALLLAALGLVALALARSRGARAWLPPLAAALAVVLMCNATGPTAAWRHTAIGAGRASLSMNTPNELHDWINTQGHKIAWQAEGVESSVALAMLGPGLAFMMNGKVDGNTIGDAPTMIMSGLLGAMLHPNPRSAMIVGLGAGGTAGWLGMVPTIERVDVVELEPLILRVARDCFAVNRRVLENPKVRIAIGDAREALLVSRQRYDLIFSEPSNPFRAGIASLFTHEYYAAARERLTDDGLFLQWVQAYEIDPPSVRTIYATLDAVFASVETWQVSPGDLLLVASRRKQPIDVERIRARLREEPFRSGALAGWRAMDVESVLAYYIGNDALARKLGAGADPNTDDRNIVEFGFARGIGRSRLFSVADVREIAWALRLDRPESLSGSVDWARVERQRIGFRRAEPPLPALQKPLTADEELLSKALLAWGGDPHAALEAWRALGREPDTPNELLFVAETLAQTGNEAALAYVERLRSLFPVEADAVLGILRFRQQRYADAAAAWEQAFVAFRTDPWAMSPFMTRVLYNARELALHDRAAALRVALALREPFAVRAIEDERTSTLIELSSKLDAKLCRDAIRSLEPFVPWTRQGLELRRDCYAAAQDPAAAEAARELQEYMSREPVPLAISLAPELRR